MRLCSRCSYRITMQLRVEHDKPCTIFQVGVFVVVEKKYDTKECHRLYKKLLGVTCKGVLLENQGAHVGARNGMDVRLHL